MKLEPDHSRMKNRKVKGRARKGGGIKGVEGKFGGRGGGVRRELKYCAVSGQCCECYRYNSEDVFTKADVFMN